MPSIPYMESLEVESWRFGSLGDKQGRRVFEVIVKILESNLADYLYLKIKIKILYVY